MLGIRINRRDNSSFDLRDILAIIGKPVLESKWRCRDLWYTVKDESSDDYIEAPRKISGVELLRFASDVAQVIDGHFEATTRSAAKRPWLKIIAVDSTYWEVWSSKHQVLDLVRKQFPYAIVLDQDQP